MAEKRKPIEYSIFPVGDRGKLVGYTVEMKCDNYFFIRIFCTEKEHFLGDIKSKLVEMDNNMLYKTHDGTYGRFHKEYDNTKLVLKEVNNG